MSQVANCTPLHYGAILFTEEQCRVGHGKGVLWVCVNVINHVRNCQELDNRAT